MLICQISDLHIRREGSLAYGIVDTSAMLERCVSQILALAQRPVAVIATGDLVDFGRSEEYRRLRSLLEPLPMPVYLLPGNHDDRQELRRAFPTHHYLGQSTEHIQFVIEALPVRVIALDTVVPGESGGSLCGDRLAWLDRTLSTAPKRPTIIAMHHPPFLTGIGHMDRIGFSDRDAFAGVVARHPQVERIICGHLHRSITTRFAGTVASTCPSPAHQVALDIDSEADDCFVMEPPGFHLHWWSGGRLVSHVAVIGDYPGPYPFRKKGELIDG
jgi:3',5'-cyclic AMP phosphodiesterase CpdA